MTEWKRMSLFMHFQYKDIMAWYAKQEDDALSKQAKLLSKLNGCWKTKQEMRKWYIDWRKWNYPLIEGSLYT